MVFETNKTTNLTVLWVFRSLFYFSHEQLAPQIIQDSSKCVGFSPEGLHNMIVKRSESNVYLPEGQLTVAHRLARS